MAKSQFVVPVNKTREFLSRNKYPVYVLTILTLVYMLNQCDTFCLIATNTSMSQELQYGERQCSPLNETVVNEYLEEYFENSTTTTPSEFCETNNLLCNDEVQYDNVTLCFWKYLGKGLEYQLIAGPLYIVLFSISGIPMGLSAELKNLNRKLMLFICIVLWSGCTILGGFCNEYWQVAVTRLLLGIFSAGCVPFSASIISDYFQAEARGAALGFFNWGVYVGYSLTFLLTIAEQQLGWRSVYFIAGAPGLVLGVFVMTSIREPARSQDGEKAIAQIKGTLAKLKRAAKEFADPCLLLLCLGGAVRNGAGLVFAYNIIIFFDEYHPGVNTAEWMSWIPLVFGSVGAFGGGYISDRLSSRRGILGRLLVLIGCLVLSAPFLIGTLYAPMPWCWVCHMIAYVIGEMWIGVCVAVVIDMTPGDLTASAVAVYFFVIQIIGGNMNVLVPPIERLLGLRLALLITFPGMYLLAAGLFVLTLAVYLRRRKSARFRDGDGSSEKGVAGHVDGGVDKVKVGEKTLVEDDVMFTQSADLLETHDVLELAHRVSLEESEITTKL